MIDMPRETTDRESELRSLLSGISFSDLEGEEISFTKEEVDDLAASRKLQEYSLENLSTNIPQRFNENIKNLEVTSLKWKKATLINPQLLGQSSETINSNIEGATKLMGVEKADYVKAALREPSLFCYVPETINTHIEDAASLIGVEKDDYVKAVLKTPSLFTILPESILGNFESLKHFIFNNSKKMTVEAILKMPTLLTSSQEKNFVHYLARAITMSKTNLIDSPIKEIEKKFERGQIPIVGENEQGMTEEGLRILKSAIDKAVEDLRAERKLQKKSRLS